MNRRLQRIIVKKIRKILKKSRRRANLKKCNGENLFAYRYESK